MPVDRVLNVCYSLTSVDVGYYKNCVSIVDVKL